MTKRKGCITISLLLLAGMISTSTEAGWPSSIQSIFSQKKGCAKLLVEEGAEMKIENRVAVPGGLVDGELRALKMLPLGSAVATTSGLLEMQGIRQIIHAASGSMTRGGLKFDPSALSVTGSVSSSLELARRNGHSRIAIPFIGGKIFASRIGISSAVLAAEVVARVLRDRGSLQVRFVTFVADDTALFREALNALHVSESDAVKVLDGSITDFSLHGCSVIVNAANTEVVFGGGLSGVIARATGEPAAIDAEAAEAIMDYYR